MVIVRNLKGQYVGKGALVTATSNLEKEGNFTIRFENEVEEYDGEYFIWENPNDFSDWED